MRRLGLVVFTDGRGEFLERTVASAQANLGPVFPVRVMVDDSGLIDNHGYLLGTYPTPQWAHVHMHRRSGQAEAVRAGWTSALQSGATHIFHLEDDFVFNGPMNIEGMADTLDAHPDLAQLFLKRQPWAEEIPVGGFMHLRPELWTQRDGFVEERHIFTWNPCLIPAAVVELALADGRPLGELMLAELLTAHGYVFACLGRIEDPPLVEHIGVYRAPGWRA